MKNNQSIQRWQTRGGRYWIELYPNYEEGDFDKSYIYHTECWGGQFVTTSDSEAKIKIEIEIVRNLRETDGINLKMV
jgi:hypothetical protein